MLILVCLLHALCGVVFTACINLAMFWTDRNCVNILSCRYRPYTGLAHVPGLFIYLFYLLLLCLC